MKLFVLSFVALLMLILLTPTPAQVKAEAKAEVKKPVPAQRMPPGPAAVAVVPGTHVGLVYQTREPLLAKHPVRDLLARLFHRTKAVSVTATGVLGGAVTRARSFSR